MRKLFVSLWLSAFIALPAIGSQVSLLWPARTANYYLHVNNSTSLLEFVSAASILTAAGGATLASPTFTGTVDMTYLTVHTAGGNVGSIDVYSNTVNDSSTFLAFNNSSGARNFSLETDFLTGGADVFILNTSSGNTNFTCQISGPCEIHGTATNDNATATSFGEVASASRLASAAVSVTSATALNVTASALSLTAGDWDVSGTICFVAAATTSVTNLTSAVSRTSATLPASDTTGIPTSGEYMRIFSTAANIMTGTTCEVFPPVRQSLSATTSVYVVAKATFSVSTMTVYGGLTARRVR